MTKLNIGLEQEFFVTDENGQLVITPTELPHDECGLLAEARGLPFNSPEEAVFSLSADVYRLSSQANYHHLTLSCSPSVRGISREMRQKAARTFAKGQVKHENLYGYEFHRNSALEQTAGIHISFTNPMVIMDESKYSQTVNAMFDWVKIFRGLDEAFAPEIKAAKRNKGFYELKCDGRIEYRSLPANTDMNKIIEVLKTLLK